MRHSPKKSSKFPIEWFIDIYWSVWVGSPDEILWGLLILRHTGYWEFNFEDFNSISNPEMRWRMMMFKLCSPVWFNSPWLEERFIWGWCSIFCWNLKLFLSTLPSFKTKFGIQDCSIQCLVVTFQTMEQHQLTPIVVPDMAWDDFLLLILLSSVVMNNYPQSQSTISTCASLLFDKAVSIQISLEPPKTVCWLHFLFPPKPCWIWGTSRPPKQIRHFHVPHSDALPGETSKHKMLRVRWFKTHHCCRKWRNVDSRQCRQCTFLEGESRRLISTA